MAMQDSDELNDRAEGTAVNLVLRQLPPRRAPPALEARVLAELARCARQPWWRRGFAHWPRGARVAFLTACSALVGCTVLGAPWALSGLPTMDHVGGLLQSWMEPATAALSSAAGVAGLLLRVIPPPWLYGGVAAAAALYATLFGLGATAYRILYLHPSSAASAGQPRC